MSSQFEQMPITNADANCLRRTSRQGVEKKVVSYSIGIEPVSSQPGQLAHHCRKADVSVRCRASIEYAALDRNLNAYIAGWAATDPVQILSVVTQDYTFHDPLVGTFDHVSLIDYFAIVQERLALRTASFGSDRFVLQYLQRRSSSSDAYRLWREVPDAGLSGTSNVVFRASRIAREAVCYEPNMASEQLRTAFYKFASN